MGQDPGRDDCWLVLKANSLLDATVLEGGFGFRRVHRVVMAGEWHLEVTWESRKARSSPNCQRLDNRRR